MSFEGPFLEVYEMIPTTVNVGASGYKYLVTIGLGLWLGFNFVSFCNWVS